MRRHGAAAVLFAALAVVWTFPLITSLSGQVLGPGPGDNLQFLWNFWWVRTALAHGLDVYQTAYMFAPVGSSLTLHTLTALPAVVAATALSGLPIATAMNLTILASLFLNGFCAYLLALRTTQDRGASVIGGIVFCGSSYLACHLNGHFNLTTAWTVPLFAMTAIEAMQGKKGWAALAGIVLAITAYTDYYYVILECALAVAIAATTGRDWSIVLSGQVSTARIRLARIAGVLLAVAALAVAAIVATGGFSIPIGSRTISAHGLFNPLQIFWLLGMSWLWLKYRPRIVSTSACSRPRVLASVAILIATFLVGATPIIRNTIALFMKGDYVTQTYFWRSAPNGVDLGTLVLGPPFHGLLGEPIRRIDTALGIDEIEAVAWLGIVPLVLAIAALRRHRDIPAVRQWAVIGSIFFVWALGPHLMVFGHDTAMILPGVFLRYIPIVNNARIPSRAMVNVSLALAILSAVGAARWRPSFANRSIMLTGLGVLIIAESIPAPFSVTTLSSPHLYETLRDRPETGAVCELPLGIRDGFGGRGKMDDVVLFYQTIHQRPLVGGYLSRTSPALRSAYAADRLLDGLLKLSESADLSTPGSLPDTHLAAERLEADGIAFVVLDQRTAPPGLTEYVRNVLPLELIATEGDRTLYVVKRPQ